MDRPQEKAIDVRAELDRLLELEDGANPTEQKRNADAFSQGVASLMVASNRDPVKFVRAILEFEVDSRSEKAIGVVALALHVSSASKGHILEAALPYLSESDARVKAVVDRLLQRIEDASPNRPPDFSSYESHVRARLRGNQDPDMKLVEHMFRRSPGEALRAFVRCAWVDNDLKRWKPLLWSAHLVDEALWKRQYGFAAKGQPDAAATAELEKMAARDEWWARLYAAEVIRQHPEFGTAELIERLRGDSHPLVKETAAAVRP